MSFDEDIKQAFERHAGDVSPTPGAWSGVERRIRRSHRIRAGLAAAGGVAAIVAAAFVVPSLVGDGGERVGPPAGTPTPTPSAPADTWVFRNERDGYWLKFLPREWRFGEFEAQVAFQPSGVPSVVEGGRTFALELWVDVGAYDDPERLGALEGGRGDAKDATVAGRRAKVRDHAGPEGGRSRTYLVDWPYRCTETCPTEPETLIVHLIATPTAEALWDQHAADAEAIVRSISVNKTDAMPPGAHVLTRRGSTTTSLVYDDATAAVVRFMEARIEGGGAEAWLGPEARRQYDSRTGGLSLYSPNERTTYVSYAVLRRDHVDASSYEYAVRITFIRTDQSMSEQRESFDEVLGVGPDSGKPYLIRFAQR